MVRRTVVAVASLVAVFGMTSVVLAQGPEDAAQAAAESWLSAVDSGNYAGSWSGGAKILQSTVNQAAWAQVLGGMRGPLGALKSRKVRSRQLTDKPPVTRTVGGKVYTWGAGQYVVLQYDSAFASRSASETVVVMAEGGGWRVASYSVH
jgi:hypothetical protein